MLTAPIVVALGRSPSPGTGSQVAAMMQIPLPPYVPHSTTGVTGLIIVASTFLLLPFVIALAIRMMRRTTPPALPSDWQDARARLDRLEQAVDTIAIEVERISEGQRFLTKVLTDGTGASVAVRHALEAAEEIPVQPIQVAEKARA